MAEVACVRMTWQGHTWPMNPVLYRLDGEDMWRRAKFMQVDVNPEPSWPLGRKGFVMARVWENQGASRVDGMLILDGDVVVDPLDIGAMFSAIHSDPESVWTAPVRIWPVSTHRQDWVWAHWDESASQVNDENPRWFSFCFTYLPGELLNAAIKKGMKGWTWPRVDSTLSKAAQQRGIKVRVVENCWPKHMHW